MKKNKINTFFLIVIILLFTAFMGCSNSDMTKVTIDLGFNQDKQAELNKSYIEKIMQFFSTKAYAAPPTGIDVIIVNVTGPGMDPLTMTIPISSAGLNAPSDIVIEVPSGNARVFTVTAKMNPALIKTAATEFQGRHTADLEGGTVTITLKMIASETKIIVPDIPSPNHRIVQISFENESEWKVLRDDIQNIGWYIDDFYPWDIDFDANGRIFIANNTTINSRGAIVRTDNIDALNLIQITPNSTTTKVALAIDRLNDIVYYATASPSSYISRCDYDGNEFGYSFATTGGTISGLAVDEEGMLYIAQNIAGVGDAIRKYDPSTYNGEVYGSIVNSYMIGAGKASDVIVKDGYVYAAIYDSGGANDKIIQLTMDLSLVAELTQKPDSSALLGPHRFAAVLNRKFYVIDEDENDMTNSNERILAFDNINGTNWEEFDPSAIGLATGLSFYFFNMC